MSEPLLEEESEQEYKIDDGIEGEHPIVQRRREEGEYHSSRMRMLKKAIKEEEERHAAEIKLIEEECAVLTGHEDDGGFMYGMCKYCRTLVD